jgi:hypothetical protein
MEAIASSVEDVLIPNLTYKLKNGSSYVQERKSSTYHPAGSNIYSTNGTKLIKISLTGDHFLDPSTFRIMFDLVNMDSTEAKELRPLGGPWSFFRRMRVLAGNQLVEDMDNYNRCHQLFSILTSPDSRANVNSEAFGQNWDIREDFKTGYSTDSFPGILGGQSQTVLFKPLAGLFTQSKLIPLRFCPITIELELVHDATEPIVSYLSGAVFNNTNTSVSWQIQNVQAKCDLLVLDNHLENSFTEFLLNGGKMPLNFNTYVSQMQSILSGTNGQQKVRLNVTRALSRLAKVFITLDKEVPSEEAFVGRKPWNDFYSPMQPYAGGANNQFNQNGEFEAQLQLGSKLYPEYPIRSHAEAYYNLRKSLGAQSSNVHNFDIDSHEYRNWKFVWGTEMEKVIDSFGSGMNTRAGDILNVRFDHRDTNAANYATSMHILLVSDVVMDITDSGIAVWD